MNPVTYLREVRTELAKVVWPSRDQVVRLSLIVILVSVIVGGYVGILDYAFTKILSLFVTK